MRYLLCFSYDGTDFYGYAKQVNTLTIQGEVEDKLSLIFNEEIKINASGRTDKGVHAYNQYAHFDSDKEINVEKLTYSLNKLLNKGIFVKYVKTVDNDFHSRFNAKCKIYEYKIKANNYLPFERNYVYFFKNLNLNKIEEASKLFIGEHSFKNFTSKPDDENNFVRNIFDIKIIHEGDYCFLEFLGDGFMRYEIRKIVGSLIAYATDKTDLKTLKEYLDKSERDIINFQAPSQGLYLKDVIYK